MSFVGKLATAAFGAVGGMIFGKKKPAAAAPAAAVLPTRNMAAEAARRRDVLSQRQGTVANMVNGARGAEASGTGGKRQLGI